jgi:DNA replication and repair protein RecF
MQRYRQILAQRNGLLRGGASAPELAAWDAGLLTAGSQACEARARWVAARRASFSRYYAAISGGQEAGFEYVPALAPPAAGEGEVAPRAAWIEAFRAELDRCRERERRRGVTLVGPHRDDLSFWMGGTSGPERLRSFGSAGQQRTAAIALRMVEAETLRAERGRAPILMLDDVLAELDPQRGRRVVDVLAAERWGQVLVTSPKPSELAMIGDSLTEYRIAGGRVRRA